MRWPVRHAALVPSLVVLIAVGGLAIVAHVRSDRTAPVQITAHREDGSAADPPTPSPTPPPPPHSVFETHQIVGFYGNPNSANMGILGEYPDDQLIDRLKDEAAKYQALNPDKTVIPALHLVYAVAQAYPGPDGSYLIHMPDEMVEHYIRLTHDNNMLFFLDLQNGRVDPVEEVKRVQHWLRNDWVHVAVDPEFTYAPGETPQEDIGEIDGAVINQIQDVLEETARDAGITNKILVVHQFREDMITNKQLIARHDRVDVVIDMDGWGVPSGKLAKYDAHITKEPVEYAGIKLFYRWDEPMLTEAQVQALTPRPDYVIYQ